MKLTMRGSSIPLWAPPGIELLKKHPLFVRMYKQYANDVWFLNIYGGGFLVHFCGTLPGKRNYLLQSLLSKASLFLIVWTILCYDLPALLKQQIEVVKQWDHAPFLSVIWHHNSSVDSPYKISLTSKHKYWMYTSTTCNILCTVLNLYLLNC